MISLFVTVLVIALFWWFITTQVNIAEPFLLVLKVVLFVWFIYVLLAAFGGAPYLYPVRLR